MCETAKSQATPLVADVLPPLKRTPQSVCGTVVRYDRVATYCCISDYRSTPGAHPFRKCTVNVKSIRKSRRFRSIIHQQLSGSGLASGKHDGGVFGEVRALVLSICISISRRSVDDQLDADGVDLSVLAIWVRGTCRRVFPWRMHSHLEARSSKARVDDTRNCAHNGCRLACRGRGQIQLRNPGFDRTWINTHNRACGQSQSNR